MAVKSKSRTRQSVSRPKRGTHPHRRSDRLRESAEQFRLAQEQLGIVTWIWEVATDRVQWYGDTARLLGLPPRGFSGRFNDYLKLLHPDDVASSRAVLHDTLKGKRPEYRTTERVVWPDGSIHWLETYGRADYGPDGRAVRMSGVVKDISERKRQESARGRAEKQLARVFEASPDYMVISRFDDGRFIAVNPAFQQVTGYRAEDIVDRTVQELKIWGIPGERDRFLADLQKQGTVQNRPVLLRTRDGTLVAGKMSATLIEHDGEKLVISLMHDVSGVKQLERRTRQLETKFAALFESSPEAISLYRLSDGVRLEANAAWERLSGYSRKHVEGQPARSKASLFLSQEHRDAIIARVEAEGAVSNLDARLRRADGSEMDALISAVRVEHDGEKCILWCWRDVTVERDTARRARQSEHKFQALFATNPAAMVVTRARERRIVEVNDAAIGLARLPRERLIGALVDDVVRLVEPRQMEQLRLRAFGGERVSDFVKFERHDGTLVEVYLSGAMVDVDGEPHFILSLLDMTEQRRMEREREQAESKYTALFATNPEAVVVTRLRDGLILAQNPACERYSGYRSDQVIGRSVAELRFWVREDDRAAVVARLEATGTVSNFASSFRRADGREIDVLLSVARIQIEGEACAIWTWRDVTEQRRVERERLEADARYRALFETSLDGILIGTPQNTLVDANPAACEMTGYSREELAGKPVAQLYHPEDLARVPLRDNLVRKWSVVERRLARKGGGEVYVEIVAGPMPDGNVLAMMRDITERKRADSALRESEARFRALTELSADWYWEQDENFRFVWQHGDASRPEANRPPRYLGLTRWEAHRDSLSAEQWAAHRAQLEAHQSFRDLEYQRPSSDGVMRWVSVSGHPIFGEDGAFRGYRGVGHDITERKRGEELLMNIARGISAEVGDAFFRSLAGHLARELDADFAFIGELVGGGERMRSLAFIADGKIAEQSDYAVRGSMSEQALLNKRTVVFSGGVQTRFPDNAEMRRAGVEAYVGTPLYGADGEAIGVLAVGHRKPVERGEFWASMIQIFGARAAAEIERARAEELVFRTNTFLEQTVQERTSQLEEANRELESYSYSISHDLRQPLNAIGGFAELLREEVAGELSPTARDFVAEIEGNSTRMQHMIESLLELSRAGRSALSKSAVDSRQVVDSVLRDLAANGRIQAEVNVGELPPAAGDPVLLRQVWVNLIGNALKYSGRSSAPRVEIGGERREGMVEYSVRDNGVGFDMQHAERLFGAFQRLPSSAGFTGSGIGLAIVERIVRRHGGSIRAEAMPGKGATFRFTLPDSPLT